MRGGIAGGVACDEPGRGGGGGTLRGGGAGALGATGAVGTLRAGKLGADRAGGAGGAGGGGAAGLVGEGRLGGGGGAAGVDDGPRPGIEGGLPNVGGLPCHSAVSITTRRFIGDTPSVFCPAGFNLGIPPANRPPNWGGPTPPDADADIATAGAPIPDLPPPPPPPLGASIIGALRSLVVAFFNLLPAWI